MRRARSSLLAAAFALPSLAVAQPFGLSGTEFRVNSYGPNDQYRPAVAVDGTGAFIIAWIAAGLDGNGNGIFAKRYTSAGAPIGTFDIEFQVNTYTSGSQYMPAVAAIGTGTYVVAWTSGSPSFQDGSGQGVYAQRWGAGPLGTEFRVNTDTFGHQLYPVVAADGSGNFVIAWQDTSKGDILARRYSSAGVPLDSPFVVNQHTTGNQVNPAVARSSAGDFAVFWFDGDNYYEIHGQRYASAGAPQGGEFPLSTHSGLDYQTPLSAAYGPSGFVVVWTLQGVGQTEIIARRFAATGAPLGGEMQVNSVTGSATAPRVAMDSRGAFVVPWQR